MKMPSREEVADLQHQYAGKRIQLDLMPEDPRPIPPGTQGTCEMVDGAGQLLVNGTTAALFR